MWVKQSHIKTIILMMDVKPTLTTCFTYKWIPFMHHIQFDIALNSASTGYILVAFQWIFQLKNINDG